MAPPPRRNQQMSQPLAYGWLSYFLDPDQHVSRGWKPDTQQSSIYGSAPMSNLSPNSTQSWLSSDLAENSKPSSFAAKPFRASDEPTLVEIRKPSTISNSNIHANHKVEMGLVAPESSPFPTLLPRPKDDLDLSETPKSAPAPSAHSILHKNLTVEKDPFKAKDSLPSSPSTLSACLTSVEDLSTAPKFSPNSRSTFPANLAVEESIAEAQTASPSSHSTHLADSTSGLRNGEVCESSPCTFSAHASLVIEERPSEAQGIIPSIKMSQIQNPASESCHGQDKAPIVIGLPIPKPKTPPEPNNVQTRVIDLSFDASDGDDSSEAPWSAQEWARLRNYRKAPELKSESSEDISDDGSIHHGATERGTDSVITVGTNDSEDQTVELRPPKRKSFTPTLAEELPTSLKNQFDAWCIEKNTDYPPCIISTHSMTPLHTSRAGNPAKWMHISGERLDIQTYKIYNSKRASLSAANLGVIVVEGVKSGIHAITRATADHTQRCSTYKIWLGSEGGDANGYELTPSVLKVYDESPNIILENFASSNVVESANPPFRRRIPGTSEKSSTPVTNMMEIPREINNLFEEWYRRYGFILPPCVSQGKGNLVSHFNNSKDLAVWTHVSGERLRARKLVFRDPRLGKGDFYTFIVESDSLVPTAIKYFSCLRDRVTYRQWVGLEKGNLLGFEKTVHPSIFKSRSSLITQRSDLTPPVTLHGTFEKPQIDRSFTTDTARRNSSRQFHLSADVEDMDNVPSEVKAQFEIWYRCKGLVIPPVFTITPPASVSTVETRRSARWTHKYGEQLEARVYLFKDQRFPAYVGYMIVVKGPSQGPSVVKYSNHESAPPTIAYKIWRGVDADNVDTNGFELTASVHKLLSVPSSTNNVDANGSDLTASVHNLLSVPSSTNNVDANGFDLTASVHDLLSVPSSTTSDSSHFQEESNSLIPTKDRPASLARETSSQVDTGDELPQVLKDKLEDWYENKGRILPPVVRSFNSRSNLDQTSTGKPAIWYHKSGERLNAWNYRLQDESIEQPKGNIAALVVQGASEGPHFVRFCSNLHRGTSFKIWLGVGFGDSEGFEEEPSVFKSSASKKASVLAAVVEKNTSSKKLNLRKLNALVRPGFQGDEFHEADGTPKMTETRLRSNPAKAKNYTIPTRREFMSGAFSHSAHKRKRDDDEQVDSDSLLESFLATNPLKRPSTAQAAKARATLTVVDPDIPKFQAHLNNNTVLMFYSKKGGPPRIRPFSLCNSIHKLFAQALAGDVFAEGAASPRVLLVRFGNGVNTEKAMSLVENDNQDFEDLLSTLKDAACWSVVGEEIRGSCTLEVKAK